MEESEARRCAEEFGRSLGDRWDEWAFELRLVATPADRGVYGFTWYPTAKDGQGRRIRIGGNRPIVVDPETGTCRLVHGATEMAALTGRSGGGTVRFRDTTARRRRRNGR
ncbi:hypothetical protein ACFCV9_08375 [Streptomyces sp. NPDC056367]|uniref:hypothetical protein n=1 Tax=Streptomyces sp. NPDC056367 TaxID=3345797 RepID=UPI0035E0259D